MRSHPRVLGILALATAMSMAIGPAASAVRAPASQREAAAGGAQLYAFGGRSAQQRASATGAKLDAALADLTRHAFLARPGHALADLQAMSPAARFIQRTTDASPLILIDAVTRGDPEKLKSALLALGLQHPAVYLNDVSGWLPVDQIEAATARVELHSIRAAMPRTRSGAVTTQGDFAQGTDALRTTYSTLTGTGITVGALSDSYDCYSVYAQNGVPETGSQGYAPNGFKTTAAQDIASGDLPSAGVKLVSTTDGSTVNAGEFPCMQYGGPALPPFGDEGRAILQVVHDVAPGAALAFHSAEYGEADFANGITALAAAGAKIIVDDVGYFDEPFFQDGVIAQAINSVNSQGVSYFSSAGNDGHNAYENTAPSFATLSHTAPTAGEYLLNFDTTGATSQTSLSVSLPPVPPADLLAVVVQWDQPYVTGAPNSPGASSHIDLCITGVSGNNQLINLDGLPVTCTGLNQTGDDSVQVLIIANAANSSGNSTAQTINIFVGLADGTAPPGRIIVSVEDNGLGAVINPALQTNSYTIQGHPNAAGAIAVGAARFFDTPKCGTSPALLEPYSSIGGAPILFDSSGTRLATPVNRTKPDVVGPDGGNNTFLGRKLTSDPSTIAQCLNNSSFPNFLGTSAAAPHVAGLAALMLQANSALTPAQIYSAIRTSAAAMDSPTPSPASGYGFVQAEAALALLPPAQPTLSFSSSSVTTGASATLTWTSINTTGCTASGAWSGTVATSGSQTVTAPSTAGTTSYTLTCSNAKGSAAATASLTAVAPSSGGGHGGGALGDVTLLVLAGLAFLQVGRRMTHRRPGPVDR